jgi:hypothetical protein
MKAKGGHTMVNEDGGMKNSREVERRDENEGSGMMMVGSEVKGKAAGPALHFLA